MYMYHNETRLELNLHVTSDFPSFLVCNAERPCGMCNRIWFVILWKKILILGKRTQLHVLNVLSSSFNGVVKYFITEPNADQLKPY